MSKPNSNTPASVLVDICEALPQWHQDHQSKLILELGDAYDASLGAVLAASLKEAQQAIVKEERDDTRMTLRRNTLVAQVRTFIGGLVSSTRLAFKNDPDVLSILKDMASIAPSRIRSIRSANRELQRAIEGIKTHREGLDAKVARAERKITQGNALLGDIAALNQSEAREAIETRRAYRTRDQLIDQAMDYIQDAHLASEALALEYPEVIAELRIIYATHNPKPVSPSTTDTLMNGEASDLNPTVNDDLDGEDEPIV